jgi:haloacetate dehalogenase
LVAFRAALNHPEVITHLGALDVIPTVDNWAALHGPGGVFAFHLCSPNPVTCRND